MKGLEHACSVFNTIGCIAALAFLVSKDIVGNYVHVVTNYLHIIIKYLFLTCSHTVYQLTFDLRGQAHFSLS